MKCFFKTDFCYFVGGLWLFALQSSSQQQFLESTRDAREIYWSKEGPPLLSRKWASGAGQRRECIFSFIILPFSSGPAIPHLFKFMAVI